MKKKSTLKAKQVVHNFYKNRCEQLVWNQDGSGVFILPALHATDYSIAIAICSTGFTILSSLECGWYGRGIYFTTFGGYAVNYVTDRKDPAIILSYVLSGNAFPVTEAHNSNRSLIGAPITAGYNSHYVLIKPNGSIPNDLVDHDEATRTVEDRKGHDRKDVTSSQGTDASTSELNRWGKNREIKRENSKVLISDKVISTKGLDLCDELVIPQEQQIVPAFLMRVMWGTKLNEKKKSSKKFK
eukprot:TRINITY_DN4594_c0_g4_i2.p1 TRINITY_DN4594_c0_g4~~TRINITY_DN4594_c0_g4_i2.p1  ORF type:complete len:242 (-),score=45.39 TRINITY_DN4594_c0_g4_i2:294-1019(-)